VRTELRQAPSIVVNNRRADIGYAMIFPGMTIVKILFVDILPALV
jgi:hypothetical protein